MFKFNTSVLKDYFSVLQGRFFICLLSIVILLFISMHLFAATYYSKGSLGPNLTTNWSDTRDGLGLSPVNFNSGDEFVIQEGHHMTTSAAWSVSGAGSMLWIESGGSLTSTFEITLAIGTVFRIDDGGNYYHNNTGIPASTIFQGTEEFSSNSTFEINIWRNNTTTIPQPSGGFGNLIINLTSDPGGSWNQAGNLNNIKGSLSILDTQGRQFRLTGNSALSLIILKDLVISNNGILNICNGNGAPTINIGGNFNQTGGTFLSSNPATVVFSGGSTSSVTFSTSGGIFTNNNIDWEITAGKTVGNNTNFGAGSWIAPGRTMTVNGVFQLNQGSWTGSSGTWTYGAAGTLVFNNSSGTYVVNSDHVYWPVSNGPHNVTVQNTGGIELNGISRAVAGTFLTSAGVSETGGSLAIGGICRINTGGFFNFSPTYNAASTLEYNTGGTYNRGMEWSSNESGAGRPWDVVITNNTTLNYPNGSKDARYTGNDLIIESGSALYMDWGSPYIDNPLTVYGTVNIYGTLKLGDAIGGDLTLYGDFNRTGTFEPNNRAVFFYGGDIQIINGTTTFDYLTVDKSSGKLVLNDDIILNQSLTLTNAKIDARTNDKIVYANGSIARTSGWVDGRLQRPVSDGENVFPVGTAVYTPVKLDFSGSSDASVNVISVTGNHPIPGSGVDPTKKSDTWYRFTHTDGTLGIVLSEFDLNNTTNKGTLANYIVKKYDGSWASTSSSVSGNLVSVTGLTSFSDFEIGEECDSDVLAYIVDTENYYCSLEDAFAAAGPDETVELLEGTASLTNPLTIGSGQTFVIKFGTTLINSGQTITNNGTMTLESGGNFTNTGIYQGSGTFNGDFINEGIVKPRNQGQ